MPLFLLAMYEKDGQPMEVIAGHFIESKFIRLKIRPYKTDNYYEVLCIILEKPSALFGLAHRIHPEHPKVRDPQQRRKLPGLSCLDHGGTPLGT